MKCINNNELEKELENMVRENKRIEMRESNNGESNSSDLQELAKVFSEF